MAIVPVVTTDEIPDAFAKVNDSFDEIPTSGIIPSQGVFKLVTFGLSEIVIDIPFFEDRITAGLEVVKQTVTDWELQIGSYQVNAISVSVNAVAVFSLSAPDATKERIDALIADDSGAINLVDGTFDVDGTPIRPTAAAGSIILHYFSVDSALDGGDSFEYRLCNTIDVYDGDDISAAIALATKGQTILVWPGVYRKKVYLKDLVNLVFKSGAVIQWAGAGAAIDDNIDATPKRLFMSFEGEGVVNAVALTSKCFSVVNASNITLINSAFRAETTSVTTQPLAEIDNAAAEVSFVGGSCINLAAGKSVKLIDGSVRFSDFAFMALAETPIRKEGGKLQIQSCKIVTPTTNSIETDGTTQDVKLYSVFSNKVATADVNQLVSTIVVDTDVEL
jgi:hypothetical protein